MPVLVGIDGSGSAMFPGAARDREYDAAFTNSFVRKICNQSSGVNTRYFRGPLMLGGGLVEAVDGAFQFIQQRRQAGVNEPILLTGYSRGAAGVVVVARKLKNVGVPVHALLLFDCVDRHMTLDAATIPSNVGNVMHVIRDPRTSSRESFSNDAMRYTPPTNYQPIKKFMCTHGGMGGCPWTAAAGTNPRDFINEGGTDGKTKVSYQQDALVSGSVWAHVQPFMRQHGYC